MLSPLRAEGLKDLEFLVITAPGFTWADHASGYDVAMFPVMQDDDRSVHTLYGADTYDVFLVDRKGRLVVSIEGFWDDTLISSINNRLRQLYAE